MDLESLAKMKRLIQAGLAEARPDGGYVVKVARESLYNEDDLTHCHPSYNVPSGYDYITVRPDQVAEMMAPDFEARLEAYRAEQEAQQKARWEEVMRQQAEEEARWEKIATRFAAFDPEVVLSIGVEWYATYVVVDGVRKPIYEAPHSVQQRIRDVALGVIGPSRLVRVTRSHRGLEARVRNVVVDEAALLARTRTNRNPIKVEGELVKLISDGSFIRVVTR